MTFITLKGALLNINQSESLGILTEQDKGRSTFSMTQEMSSKIQQLTAFF